MGSIFPTSTWELSILSVGRYICPPWAEKLIIAELTKLYIIQSGGDDATVLQQAEEIIKKNI